MHIKKVMKVLQILIVATIVAAGIMMMRAIKILISLLLNEGNM